MGTDSVWIWVAFNLFVLGLLALDLGVFHRKAHAVSVKEAAIWSVVWIALSLAFNVLIYFWRGPQPALQFFTGYLIEKSLSVDNIFVFVLLFSFFAVPATYQHRVLFWGILGALLMRGALIAVGAVLLERFHWVIFIFGAFLIFTGIRMALHRGAEEIHPENNPVVKIFRRFMPVTGEYHGERFFIRQAGKWMATPLFMVLLIVETTDLVFAVDSIPAIFAVTQDPFIVYTSNVFAILGLRSLYFVLAGVMDKFYYLKLGLAVILTFVGVKMLISDIYHIPITLSLSVIAAVLVVAAAASWLRVRRLGSQKSIPFPDLGS
ncbi:MAG: TerC family protein [Chloroflexi bacterium]|nr:TerC family protein [Chloroflexota bacterium]